MERTRGGSWTPKNRSKADLGTPRASQERPRAVQKRLRDGPKTLPDRSGAMSECIRASSTVERARRTIFRCFGFVARKLRCVKNVAPANVLYISHEVNTERVGVTKKLENQGVSVSKNKPGCVRETRNRARAAMFERQNAKIEREAMRFFLSLRARASRSEKSAPETGQERRKPRGRRTPVRDYR